MHLSDVSIRALSRSGLLLALISLQGACDAPLPDSTPPTPPPATTPTTLIMVVTVPPIPTVARPTPAPIAVAPTPTAGPEGALRLASDGISTPPGFRLAGGAYLIAWDVPRPSNPSGCHFGAILASGPSVQPPMLRTLGPWTVEPSAGHTGSMRIDGLGAGVYTLRPSGTCPWTVTITPIGNR